MWESQVWTLSALAEEHDGAKMKQGAFVMTRKWEISHLSAELTKESELF